MMSLNEYKAEEHDDDTNLSTLYNSETFDEIDMDEFEIGEVIDIITDVDEIKKMESKIKSTSFNYKDYKRNDIVWITVMLKPRNNSTAYKLGEMGVLRCKILQTYYGLNKLKQLKNRETIINF